MHVLASEEDSGVATMTISIADDDHKFDVWVDGDTAFVEYQETLSWRGQIQVAQPDALVYKELMLSDEMTTLLNKWGVDSVKRATPMA